MENLSAKIYGAKEGIRYFAGRKQNYETGKTEAITTVNVNYAKLMTAQEVRKVLEEFPAFSSCIINTLNR